jgi:S-adenosylmethionine:tRNA ribosyltransferase-isomerase
VNISEIDFALPPSQIAQSPAERRDASRLLLVDRRSGELIDEQFLNIIQYISKGDLLVVNNTKVFPARLRGTTSTGASVEVFLVKAAVANVWETLAKPARRLAVGKTIDFGPELSGEVVGRTDEGRVLITFNAVGDFYDVLERVGETPLPPYIQRPDGAGSADAERYQTVYAAERGAIAAPTAGLHFTPEILAAVKDLGAEVVELTLHVGYATFEPVRVDDLSQHRVAPENYHISDETAASLNAAKRDGRRIIAVGTTSTRALEDNASRFTSFTHGFHEAAITITPGYEFKAVDALLTNFHLPKSSLLILTSTFGGRELIMKAYEHAVAGGYRFYSYGDCMLIV